MKCFILKMRLIIRKRASIRLNNMANIISGLGWSFFISSFLLDVEVFNLVAAFAVSDDVQKFSKTVLLQVFFGQVFKISLWEGNIRSDVDFFVVVGNLDIISEFSNFSTDFNSLSEEFSEVCSVEYLVFDGLWAVNAEGLGDFLLLCDFLTHGYYWFYDDINID